MLNNKTARTRNSFEENLEALFQELSLAVQWGRPSILLAVNKSKLGQDKAEKALENKLREHKQNIVKIEIKDKNPNVASLISQTPDPDKTIFFISHMDWGGGADGKEAYRALNMHREFFVENKIRAVFWLTMNEALNLPKHSPDFWAFRHRVIEFTHSRAPHKIGLPAGILIWHAQDSINTRDQPEERISAYEKMLLELPTGRESVSARMELLYVLGYLCWSLGDSARASKFLTAGLDLSKNLDLPHLQPSLANGLAVIRYEVKEYREAVDIYNEAMEGHPLDSILLFNLSAALCALGRNQQALSTSKRAIKADPANARVWNRIGYLYISMGRLDEAIRYFQKAIELAPSAATHYESLAIGYAMLGRADEAIRQMNRSREVAGEHAFHADVYEQALLENSEKLLHLLRAALEAGQISRTELRRDPNIHLLLDPDETDALLDSP